MCLVLLAYHCHADYALIIAANRDEFHTRPTAPATFWSDVPEILAGRDLQGDGTWLGISRHGHIAAITNYRELHNQKRVAPSRGMLVSAFLQTSLSIQNFTRCWLHNTDVYNGFNLILGIEGCLYYYSNRQTQSLQIISPGIHGLSNHLLDTPWPKVRKAKQAFQDLLASPQLHLEQLFDLLNDRSRPADEELPKTGGTLEQERLWSSIFNDNPIYGTRCSTLVLIGKNGEVSFFERSFSPMGQVVNTVKFEMVIPAFGTYKPKFWNQASLHRH